MPLTGDPKKDIPELMEHGHPQKQAVAIALKEERKDVEPAIWRIVSEPYGMELRKGVASNGEDTGDWKVVLRDGSERKFKSSPEAKSFIVQKRGDAANEKWHNVGFSWCQSGEDLASLAREVSKKGGNSQDQRDAREGWKECQSQSRGRDDADEKIKEGDRVIVTTTGQIGTVTSKDRGGAMVKFPSGFEAYYANSRIVRADSESRLDDILDQVAALSKRVDLGCEEMAEAIGQDATAYGPWYVNMRPVGPGRPTEVHVERATDSKDAFNQAARVMRKQFPRLEYVPERARVNGEYFYP